MPRTSDIPVDMYGIVIGTASISNDGVINLQIEGPCELGMELSAQLGDQQDFTGITILPRGSMNNSVPLPPQPTPDPEPTEG